MTLQISDYKILQQRSTKDLVTRVKEHMTEGWEPVGGASHYVNMWSELVFIQTMIFIGSKEELLVE